MKKPLISVMTTLRKRTTKIVLIGLAVHLFLLIAAADVYFSSPLDQGMTSIKIRGEPPANRLVFIVADGLRAQAVYGENTDNIPYLTTVRKNRGAWGIAHTRVPTESRPGHVAMLAGIYEDPSAVFKGWKANAVEFDHIIQQSKNAWCWGSPDIVNLFTRDNLSHVHVHAYGSELEDFGKRSTVDLDHWVFNEVKKFFESTHDIPHLNEPGNFFFLHLLGIDTAGHGFKPDSNEYISNIQMVDAQIEQVEKIFTKVFPDNKTAFIFTADHGMTNWGSHGSGSDDETKVPFIIWGSGIKHHPYAIDINQIDISPLMASLIGISIPINSQGILPYEYLQVSREKMKEMIKTNIYQLLEIFNVKISRLKNAIFPVDFRGLTLRHFTEEINKLDSLNLKDEYDTFLVKSQDIMKQLVYGIGYYHNYFKSLILVAVSIGFLAWLLFLASMMVSDKDITRSPIQGIRRKKLNFIALWLFVILSFLTYVQSFPWVYYIYFSFPLIMWYTVGLESKRVMVMYTMLKRLPTYVLLRYAVLGYTMIVLFMWGFENTAWFSLAIIIQSYWIFMSYTFEPFLYTERFSIERKFWICINLLLAIFPAARNIFSYLGITVHIFGMILSVMALLYLNFRLMKKMGAHYDTAVVQTKYLTIQWGIFFLTCIWKELIEYRFIASDSPLKTISWILFVLPLILIPFTATFTVLRFSAIIFGFAPFYLMMATNYEIMFMTAYIMALYAWINIESRSKSSQLNNPNFVFDISYSHFKSSHDDKSLSYDDIRRSFQYVCYILTSFFGSGNIASINFFDPMWTKCFLTVFSPFTMSALIIFKISVPFIYASCAFRAVIMSAQTNLQVVFSAILFISDFMLIHFLYSIKNVGSWLEIGTSLSYFVVMEAFTLIILLLYGIAHLLTTSYVRPLGYKR